MSQAMMELYKKSGPTRFQAAADDRADPGVLRALSAFITIDAPRAVLRLDPRPVRPDLTTMFNPFGPALRPAGFLPHLGVAAADGRHDVPAAEAQPAACRPVQAKLFLFMPLIFWPISRPGW
jgi:hypothetical protein